jgi:hypothetical protein
MFIRYLYTVIIYTRKVLMTVRIAVQSFYMDHNQKFGGVDEVPRLFLCYYGR